MAEAAVVVETVLAEVMPEAPNNVRRAAVARAAAIAEAMAVSVATGMLGCGQDRGHCSIERGMAEAEALSSTVLGPLGIPGLACPQQLCPRERPRPMPEATQTSKRGRR